MMDREVVNLCCVLKDRVSGGKEGGGERWAGLRGWNRLVYDCAGDREREGMESKDGYLTLRHQKRRTGTKGGLFLVSSSSKEPR